MHREFDRISTVDGFLATVKFVGKVSSDSWGPDVICYGVEWDDPTRGKNNGDINGKHYFKPEIANAGSFLKINNKKISNNRVSFYEAIRYHYGIHNQFCDVSFGTKTTESYGFEKLNNIQSNFETIQSISLDRKQIFCEVTNNTEGKQLRFPNVKYLDLSYNLFNDASIIWDILKGFPVIEELNLSGNRFFFSPSYTQFFPNVKMLSLAFTGIRVKFLLTHVLPAFPNLEELDFSGNRLGDEDANILIESVSKVRRLNLSYNEMTKVPHISEKSSIFELDMSNNKIDRIATNNINSSLLELNLSSNKIVEWNLIDKLATLFPHIISLRINHNPLLTGLSTDVIMMNIIGRFHCKVDGTDDYGLEKIDGAKIMYQEIESNELYFISSALKGKCSFDISSERGKFLLKKYNLEPIVKSSSKPGFFSPKLLTFTINLNGKHKEVKLMKDSNVIKLKGILSKELGIDFTKLRLYYYMNGNNEKKVIKDYLGNNFSSIDSYGLKNKEVIHVEIQEPQK